MKHISFFGAILFMGILISCSSQKAAVIPPFPLDSLSMDLAVRKARENPAELKKYIFIDENKDIFVKAELTERNEAFEVIYDMKRAGEPAGSAGGFLVPFAVESLKTGGARQDTLVWKPQKDAAGILLAFDDNYMEVWERYFDLFDDYGARVTFFVQGEFCSFCRAALERGHDVGYHSLNHLNLPKVSREVFDEETLSRLPAFRSSGVPLDSFAFPFGLSEPWMHEELLKTFKIVRGYGVTFRVYDSAVIRKGSVSSRAIDTILFKKDEAFEAMIAVMLRTVKFIGGDLVLPLTTHDISDTADWGIKPRRLQYLLQNAKDLQLTFYRYKDFFEPSN